MNINIQKIKDNAVIPTYQTTGSAAMDLISTDSVTLEIGTHVQVGTGLVIEIPAGYVGLVYSNAANAENSGINLSNGVGVISSDFRGEIQLSLHNAGYQTFDVNAGDKIAQLVIVPYPDIQFTEVTNLTAGA